MTTELGLIGGLSDYVVYNDIGLEDLYRNLLALVMIEAFIDLSESTTTNLSQNRVAFVVELEEGRRRHMEMLCPGS
jgi:hypothetical protein